MAQSAKYNEDTLFYWYHMQAYHQNLSLIGRQYYLDTELRKFLLEVTNPKVYKLLDEFIKAKDIKNV